MCRGASATTRSSGPPEFGDAERQSRTPGIEDALTRRGGGQDAETGQVLAANGRAGPDLDPDDAAVGGFQYCICLVLAGRDLDE
jgi:hypothetical protein